MIDTCVPPGEQRANREYQTLFILRVSFTKRLVDAGEDARKLITCQFWANIESSVTQETMDLIMVPDSRDWFGENECDDGFGGFLYAYANCVSCLHSGRYMIANYGRQLTTGQFATE